MNSIVPKARVSLTRLLAFLNKAGPSTIQSSSIYTSGSVCALQEAGSNHLLSKDRSVWNSEVPETAAHVGPSHLVFLGCPGVGKGTYASRVAKLLNIPHISTGDLVRSEVKEKTSVGKLVEDMISRGHLLPDEIIFEMLSKRLSEGAAVGENGFILDGFPRSTIQAETLEQITSVDLVLNLKLRSDVLIAKCLGRRTCAECGGNFNTADINVESQGGLPNIVMPPLLYPPQCESKMTQRADDIEEVVRSRLEIYEKETKPVEGYYRSRGLLVDFEVLGGIPETWPRLLSALHLNDATIISNAA